MKRSHLLATCIAIFASSTLCFGHLDAESGEKFGDTAPPFDAYCMRNIPEVPILAGSRDLFTVRQVQTFIRHGARTRCMGTASSCWEGDENTLYQCDNAETMGTSLDGRLRFMKIFEENENVLKGNCMLGQLTSVGYGQQR